jgi:hypothetical protein
VRPPVGAASALPDLIGAPKLSSHGRNYVQRYHHGNS